MAQQAFYEGATLGVGTVNTQKVEVIEPRYSIQVNVSGTTFDVSVKLQTSIDETNWTDIDNAESLAITADKTVHFDIATGRHKFIRAVFTVNSGTVDVAEAFISNGKW